MIDLSHILTVYGEINAVESLRDEILFLFIYSSYKHSFSLSPTHSLSFYWETDNLNYTFLCFWN